MEDPSIMEVDTGATVSLISKWKWQQVLPAAVHGKENHSYIEAIYLGEDTHRWRGTCDGPVQ